MMSWRSLSCRLGWGSNPLQVVAMAALAAATAGVGAWAASAYAGAAGVAATSAAALTVGAGAATAVGLVGGMVVNSLFHQHGCQARCSVRKPVPPIR